MGLSLTCEFPLVNLANLISPFEKRQKEKKKGLGTKSLIVLTQLCDLQNQPIQSNLQ